MCSYFLIYYSIFGYNTKLCKNILLSTWEPYESFCLLLTPSISLCSADDSPKPGSSINPSQTDQQEINDFFWTQSILTLQSRFHSPCSSTNLQMIKTKYECFLSLCGASSIFTIMCKFFFHNITTLSKSLKDNNLQTAYISFI